MSEHDHFTTDPPGSCGACQGIQDATPLEVVNRPGLSTIQYRVGDHARFKRSLLAGLSRASRPALHALTTRENDDFSIALLDAFSTMADVLTFYQERIATESYLRTATERRSIAEIGRLIGYELRPGAAARTYLAFTLEEGPGSVETVKLAVGTKVQSTPGPGEKPQMFETIEEIEARPAWNRIRAKATRSQELSSTTASVRLKGIGLNVRQGDGLLLVFRTPGGTDFTAVSRGVQSVEVDSQGQWTRVELTDSPVSATFDGLTPPQTGVFVFRTQASLFGYNAPAKKVNPDGTESDWQLTTALNTESGITLDTVYREIVPGSWGVWQSPATAPSFLIFKVNWAVAKGFSEYGLSGKATVVNWQLGKNVSGSVALVDLWRLRSVSVFAQSEQLELAELPADAPVEGNTVAFAARVEGLTPGRRIVLTGKRLRAEVLKPVMLFLWTSSGWIQKGLQPGYRLDLLLFPIPVNAGAITYFVAIENAQLGVIAAQPGEVRYRNDEQGVELATITSVADDGKSITIAPPLTYRYDPRHAANDPPSVTTNANVAEATHGETVQEMLGSGDAAQAFQRFTLRQPPLTHVPALTPSGTRSTLRVWVDDVEWREVPTLYGRGPKDRVFVSRMTSDGKTFIEFGDGVIGARLPTGQQNVRATYRKGIGAEGILKPGQINLLMSRPLGLKEAINPVPSTDARDPEALEDARQNAPLTVLTLDRVVSLQDYEDISRAFAGIAKAGATWTWFGQTRGVFITVAGWKGGAVSLEGRQQLRAAIAEWGDPFIPLRVENYQAVSFRVGSRLKIASDYEPAKVLARTEAALRAHFSFERRAFGQAVTLAEVSAVAQAVPGVVAIQVTRLYRTGDSNVDAGLSAPLGARAPQPGERDAVDPAELLTLDPAPLDLLEEMT